VLLAERGDENTMRGRLEVVEAVVEVNGALVFRC
jgi:hypothetical protein